LLIIAAVLHSTVWGFAVIAGCILASGLLFQSIRVSRLRRDERSVHSAPSPGPSGGGAHLRKLADPDKVKG
jgi:hypothetical protein